MSLKTGITLGLVTIDYKNIEYMPPLSEDFKTLLLTILCIAFFLWATQDKQKIK